MTKYVCIVDSYFDGEHVHHKGPYSICVNKGHIADIELGDAEANPGTVLEAYRQVPTYRAAFAMPGLVEAHAHLFLDGHENDTEKRKVHLKLPREEMLEVAQKNLEHSMDAGITLVRDAGDKHGINLELRQLHEDAWHLPIIRAPGAAIRKKGRYGSFMAREVECEETIRAVFEQVATHANDIKILLTGIIDFEHAVVKGDPQFSLQELHLLCSLAHERQLQTYAHCSGLQGLHMAIEAGVDSIEHGFFMDDECLQLMADKNIAWVPTFSPVHFQWAEPEWVGWNQASVDGLKSILDSHFEHINKAARFGVEVVPGSDAGSHGVPHGRGLINELEFLSQAGMSDESILYAATTLPRKRWNSPLHMLRSGSPVDFILCAESPLGNMGAMHTVSHVFRGEHEHQSEHIVSA